MKQLGVLLEVIGVESTDVPVVVDVCQMELEPLIVCRRATVLLKKVSMELVEGYFIIIVFVDVLEGLVVDFVARTCVRE